MTAMWCHKFDTRILKQWSQPFWVHGLGAMVAAEVAGVDGCMQSRSCLCTNESSCACWFPTVWGLGTLVLKFSHIKSITGSLHLMTSCLVTVRNYDMFPLPLINCFQCSDRQDREKERCGHVDLFWSLATSSHVHPFAASRGHMIMIFGFFCWFQAFTSGSSKKTPIEETTHLKATSA